MKTFKQFKEDAPVMSVGASGMQGLGSAQGTPIAGYDKLMFNKGKVLRRKKPAMFVDNNQKVKEE